MAKCSRPVGRGYKVGVGRNRKTGRFCNKKRSGCSHDGALASAIKSGLKRTAKGLFC